MNLHHQIYPHYRRHSPCKQFFPILTDRCHRIGQTRKVTIYKMVTKDTVDADIYEMQERKAKMNAAIMESNEAKKERKVMLQAVVDRFLKSPKKRKKEICVL